ncbi:Erg29p NDAI_0H02870 [Naumovozyma dairenensis CBS 421]|uniref:Uncharacterized protein n=1 Tax=Naumovozyma dairenensis (strain ATCC 10597 / BCRC 20456 / CBS 421 / NBRC 0211 / NRRL Y-12639) TaxID=1071378 RepID=G0WFA0_NAUDC|nr:hypothetical protein NDAI_0H02870 [Naumovozyma dairenensis CBS 421]CCD26461.1 hypothetical protein NDAI_0H02870 [Naumovozyma dairenensis CBS 421]
MHVKMVMNLLCDKYLKLESEAITWLSRQPYVHQFIHDDRISGRITLYLIIIGFVAFCQELYITIEMSLLQKETYDALNNGKIDESLRLHRMLINEEFHSHEYLDEKNGIVIEEFEDRDKFFSKPVHVSSLYINCYVVERKNGDSILDKPFKFHIEFSPEDFENEKRVEFGCSLKLLREKLYYLFKDSEIYHELMKDRKENGKREKEFTISNGVEIYNRNDEILPHSVDDIQLCFLKLETNDTIRCNFIL